MLVQSHTGVIEILPALPDVWKDGTVKGLQCRGGFIIEELTWKDGFPVTLKIRSTAGGPLNLVCNRMGHLTMNVENTSKGRVYDLLPMGGK